MRALITSATPPHAELASVPDPAPRDNEALVEVHAISLNRGEVRQLAAKPPGTVTGWDLAGVVRTRAADGGGPAEGARVVGMVPSGAWAQLAAVRTTHLAVLPDEVSFEQAAALPVAGLTALRALEAGGFVLGKRVLVTGASGGVGRFGIQLARLAGAHVTAVARRTDGLRGLGADAVLSDLEQEGPTFDVVLDAVGGATLGTALCRVAPGGTVISFAATAPDPVAYPARAFFARAPGARLYALFLFDELERSGSASADLRRLADLVGTGRLDPQIALRASWSDSGTAIEALIGRRVNGKAVLTVDQP